MHVSMLQVGYMLCVGYSRVLGNWFSHALALRRPALEVKAHSLFRSLMRLVCLERGVKNARSQRTAV